MGTIWRNITIIITATSFVLSACSEQAADNSETQTEPLVERDFGVVAEGRITPRQHVDMAFSTAGRVAQVSVEEGETISAGQLLARLENEPQLRAAAEQARSNAKQAESSTQQARSAVEQARSAVEQARSSVEQARSAVEQSKSDIEQARSNVELAQFNLSQTALEIPQINLELALAGLESITARHKLSKLYDNAAITTATIQAEVAQAKVDLEEAEHQLIMIDKPDIDYYQDRITEAENMLMRLQREAEIIRIGTPTDAVDRAVEFLDDEQEFLEKVKKSDAGCKIAVDSGDNTKLIFTEELTYRSQSYDAGGVYDVPDWIAEELLADFSGIVSKPELTCDPKREHTVDGRKVTLQDAQEDYDDAVTQLEQAERERELSQLANEQAIRDTEEALGRAKRNLEWATSSQYSKQGIQGAESQSSTDITKPESIESATLLAQADIAAASARLAEAQKRFARLQEGINPEDLEIAQAEVTQADTRIILAEARKGQVQPRIRQAEAALTAAEASAAAAPPTLEAAEARYAASEAGFVAAEAAFVAAEAGLIAAESGLLATQADVKRADAELEKNELRAPWDGTVADLDLKENEYVVPGQAILSLADLSAWVVETDNLTEIEVPEVSVGQLVTITPDALPSLTLAGKVASIASLYDEKRGDVTYTVTVGLDKSDPRLRWGMTVVVQFPPDE